MYFITLFNLFIFIYLMVGHYQGKKKGINLQQACV